MDNVIELDMSPINAVAEKLQQRVDNPRGCVAIVRDSDGVYYFASCEMSSGELLAAAEVIRHNALDLIMEGGDD